jgi:4-amino-4-deoxy-L-arabinose transferase-like glycosyltransferase
LCGALLRFWALDHESYWLDELSAVTVAGGSWDRLFSHLETQDVHPPLYFALLKIWMAAFGSGETSTRSLSVVIGLFAILFAALLAAELARDGPHRRRAALLAAALLAVSPFAVYYARETRGYSLLLCTSLAATWLLVRAAPELRARSLVPYAAAAALMLYTHLFGLLTLAAHGLYVLAVARRNRRALIAGFLALLVAALCYVPWIPATLAQARRVQQGFWIARPDPEMWLRAWLAEGALAVIWVLASCALLVIWLRRAPRPQALLVTGGLLLPSLLPIALSYLRQPIFMAKYAIAASGLLLVAAALALAASTTRRAAALAVALALVGAGEAIRDVHLWRHKEQWRELAAFASHESVVGGTPLVLTVHYKDFLRHYLDPRATLWPVGRHELTTAGRDGLARRLAERGVDRFWLLNVHPARTDPALEPLFRSRWVPTDQRSWHMAEAILWVDARSLSGHNKEQEERRP